MVRRPIAAQVETHGVLRIAMLAVHPHSKFVVARRTLLLVDPSAPAVKAMKGRWWLHFCAKASVVSAARSSGHRGRRSRPAASVSGYLCDAIDEK